MLDQREQELLQEAIRRVMARYGSGTRYSGRVTSRGNVVWQAFAYNQTGARFGFERIGSEERQLLEDQTNAEYLKLLAEREPADSPQPESPPPAAAEGSGGQAASQPPPPPEPRELQSLMQHVTEGGQVRYFPTPEGYTGQRFYRTSSNARPMTELEYRHWQERERERLGRMHQKHLAEMGYTGEEEAGAEEADGTGGTGGTGSGGERASSPMRDLWTRAMQGAVLGGVGASLAGAAVAGLSAPITTALGIALEGAGATGSGVMRIANGLISLFSSGLQLAANVGGAVLGGAIGLMLGGALGAAAGGVAGTIAGALGGIFSNAGRMLGETIGAAGQIMRDTAQTAVNLSDNIMRLSLVSGQAVSSVSGLTTTLRLLGMGSGAAESMFGSWGQRIEFLQMRFGALGVEMAKNRDGTLDWQRTLLNVSDWLQNFDPMLRQPYARALLGPGADQMMPYLQDRGQLEQAAAAADELAPRAETVKRAWDDLRIPLQEINVLWDTLKVEFVSGFIPMIAGGIENLTGLWATHKDSILAWFAELPGTVTGYLENIANWLQDLVDNVGPTLSALWDGFIRGAQIAKDVLDAILGAVNAHPYLTAVIAGASIGGVRGGPGGALAGGVQGATTLFAGQRVAGGLTDPGGQGQQQPSFWRTLGEGALTLGSLIVPTLLSRRFGAAGRAARTAGAAGEGADVAAAALGSGAQWRGLFGRIGGGIAGGYRRLVDMGATEMSRAQLARTMTQAAARDIPSTMPISMMTEAQRSVALAARAGRAAPGMTPTFLPYAEGATRGLSGFTNALRGIGTAARGVVPGLRGLGATVARAFTATGPVGMAIGAALAGWGIGTGITHLFNIGGARDARQITLERKEREREAEGRKSDARDRGYVLIEDVAESMGLKKKWERGKLSDDEQSDLWNEFRRQRQAAGRPRDSIRGEVDPAMNRRWGDWFKDLGDKLQNKDQKPLKVEGEVKIRQEMDVRPSSEFNVSLMRNEVSQAWRDIQLAVS